MAGLPNLQRSMRKAGQIIIDDAVLAAIQVNLPDGRNLPIDRRFIGKSDPFDAMPPRAIEPLADPDDFGQKAIPAAGLQLNFLQFKWEKVSILDEQQNGQFLTGFETMGGIAEDFGLATIIAAEGEEAKTVVDFRVKRDGRPNKRRQVHGRQAAGRRENCFCAPLRGRDL